MSVHQFVLLLHLLGAGVMIGIGFFSLYLVLRSPVEAFKIRALESIRGAGFGVASWQLITGLHLTIYGGHWVELRTSWLFWLKMAVFVADGVLAEKVIRRELKRINDLPQGAGLTGQAASQPLKLTLTISALFIALMVTIGFFLAEGISQTTDKFEVFR